MTDYKKAWETLYKAMKQWELRFLQIDSNIDDRFKERYNGENYMTHYWKKAMWCIEHDNDEWDDFINAEVEPHPLKTILGLDFGDCYATVGDNGRNVYTVVFTGCEEDNERLDIGNAFTSTVAAQKAVKAQKIHQDLRWLAGGYKFNPEKDNWYIQYDYSSGNVLIGATMYYLCWNQIYFNSYDDVVKAIEEIGKDVLIKDYFMIEEKEEDED